MKIPDSQRILDRSKGSALIFTILALAGLVLMLGLAFDSTSSISRNAQRICVRQQALFIGDSALEMLFAQFKNVINNYSSALGDIAPKRADFVTYLGFQTSGSKVPTGAAFPELAAYFPNVSNFSSLHLDNNSVAVITNYAIEPLDATGRVASSGTGSYVTTLTSSGLTEGRAYRYLATVDVQLPVFGGQVVTAHLSRVFEFEVKSFLTYAIFSNNDLEIHPGAAMSITGPVHTNANMYVGDGGGTLNFTDTVDASGKIVNGRMSIANGSTVNDPQHGDSPTTPTGTGWTNRVPNSPQVTPLDVKTSSFNTTDANLNNDSYHAVLELPVFPLTTNPDPLSPGDTRTSSTQAFDSKDLQTMRFANVADYVITIDNSTHDPRKAAAAFTVSVVSGNNIVTLDTNSAAYKAFQTVITLDSTPIQDPREAVSTSVNTVMNLTNVNVKALKTAVDAGSIVPVAGAGTGLGIYIADNRNKVTYSNVVNPKYNSGSAFPAQTSTAAFSGTYGKTQPAIRIQNGATLPAGGLTVVTPNPVYIQGDFNTGAGYNTSGALTAQPSAVAYNHSWPQSTWTDQTTHDPTTLLLANSSDPSQTGVTFTDPSNSNSTTATNTYYWQPAAIIGDAITVLSNAWVDSNSTKTLASKPTASATVINSAFFGGNVTTTNSVYSGGVENFPRFLESWSSVPFYYIGSMVLLYNSAQATGGWDAMSTYYNPPTRRWAYDKYFLSYGVPLLTGGGSGQGGAAGGGSRKTIASGGGKLYARKQWISRTVQ